MQQLTTKEIKIYENYIFEQIAERFKDFGTINIEYLKIVTNFKYEISYVTNLIYPTIEFRKSFEKLKTLSKIELNDKPNDLFDKYKIKTVQIPVFYIFGKRETRFTPYEKSNQSVKEVMDIKEVIEYVDNLKPLAFPIQFKQEDFIILTNGDQKEFDFIDKNKNDKKYLLPINYEKNKSLDLYQHYRDIKGKIRDIVEKIKPIDNQKLYDLIIEHYKNV